MAASGDHAEIYRTADGHWWWRIKAGNNEIVMQGESYRHRADAEHLIRTRFGDDLPIVNLEDKE